MSKGSNVLRKHAGGAAPGPLGEPGGAPENANGGATAVWAGRVVVVPEEPRKKEKGGLGSFLFGGGSGKEKERAREREREREREKEQVVMERAREREREREKGKKLSKARR